MDVQIKFKKSKLQSDVINKSLNPVWNMKPLDLGNIMESESKSVKVTVWDYDKLSGKDFMGAVWLPAAGLYAAGPGHHEWWIPLAKGKKSKHQKSKVTGDIFVECTVKDVSISAEPPSQYALPPQVMNPGPQASMPPQGYGWPPQQQNMPGGFPYAPPVQPGRQQGYPGYPPGGPPPAQPGGQQGYPGFPPGGPPHTQPGGQQGYPEYPPAVPPAYYGTPSGPPQPSGPVQSGGPGGFGWPPQPSAPAAPSEAPQHPQDAGRPPVGYPGAQ